MKPMDLIIEHDQRIIDLFAPGESAEMRQARQAAASELRQLREIIITRMTSQIAPSK